MTADTAPRSNQASAARMGRFSLIPVKHTAPPARIWQIVLGWAAQAAPPPLVRTVCFCSGRDVLGSGILVGIGGAATASFAETGDALALNPDVLPMLLQSVHVLGVGFWLGVGALAPGRARRRPAAYCCCCGTLWLRGGVGGQG